MTAPGWLHGWPVVGLGRRPGIQPRARLEVGTDKTAVQVVLTGSKTARVAGRMIDTGAHPFVDKGSLIFR